MIESKIQKSEGELRKAKLKRAIRRLVKAEINLSWMGSMHPDDHDEIETEYRNAKKNLKKIIDEAF